MKMLQLTKAQRAAALIDDARGERSGIFTSGIVATAPPVRRATAPCKPYTRELYVIR